MSMYLDFDELRLLFAYSTAELLSQYNFSGLSIDSTIRSLVTKLRSHTPWFDASWHATNSAAIVEDATSDYLALFHEIAPPANI